MEEDPCGINRNKRKFQDEELEEEEVRVAKHTCTCLSSEDIIKNDTISSANDSNSFSEDANSIMSVSDDSLHASSSSSVNCGETRKCDSSPTSEDFEFTSSSDRQTLEICSNSVLLSSGRWNVNQDTEQDTPDNLTIDKEFEQYFSMLML